MRSVHPFAPLLVLLFAWANLPATGSLMAGLGRPTEEAFHYLAGLGFGNWVRVGSTYQGADPFRAGLTYHNGLPGNQDDLATANTFDTRGRLSAIDWQPSTSMQALASYLHDGSATRRRTTHFGTGANAHFATDYQYDTYGRMTQITQSFSSGAQVDFVYDLASNLVKEVYQKQGGSNRAGDRFTYDEHHRLHKAWLGADTTLMQDANPETSTGSFVEKLTYGLDAAQNRTTLQRQAGSGGSIGTESYSVQEAGEPQGASNRYDQVGAVAPTYDQRGNTTFDGNFYYVYDEQNRLSEVYILSGDSAARSTSTTSLAAEAPTGSTREQTRRGRFAVPDVVVLQRARQRLLARATGGPEEILRRHAEPAFVRQLREPLGNSLGSGAARRVVEGGSESLQSRSSGTGEGGVEEDVELQLLAVYLYDVFDRRVLRVVVGVQTWVVAWDGWQEAEELVPTWQNGLVMAPQRQFELAKRVSLMRQAGMSSEEIARALHAERRALGVRFKALAPAKKLTEIHARSLRLYGGELGPSIDWLTSAGKSWDAIIESATRPGGKDLSS